MACYGAVISLGDTIVRLLQCSGESTEILIPACEMIDSVLSLLRDQDASCGRVDENEVKFARESTYEWKERNSLYELLKHGRSGPRSSIRSIGQRMNDLDAMMREAARELEDALETHLRHLQLEKLRQDIDSFCRKVVELKEEYANYKNEAEEDEYDDVDDDLSSGKKKKMVGYSDVLAEMKDDLFSLKLTAPKVRVLVGMAGIGKTTLASRFFEDPNVSDFYDYRVWVTVGPNFQFIDILKSILNQVNPNTTGNTLTKGDELVWQFYAAVEDRRCLIVLDDVWNDEIIPPVIELLGKANPHRKELWYSPYLDSTILVTSRLEKIGAPSKYRWPVEMIRHIEMIKLRFMNKDESWDLLRDRVFGEDLMSCTPQLVKAGKNIAENCEGLPYTIVTIADILSKKKADDTTMTPEYWNQVAERQNSVFVDAYQQMSKVLLRSYEFLPRNLKECFLYMGVFPEKYDIPFSKLALLWGVEGCFLSIRVSKNIEYFQDHVSTNMKALIGKSLVLVRKTNFKNQPKTYGIHSALWHSCVVEADKNKFFHVFNKYADVLEPERTRNQRRLCVHNNVLFGIKDVRNSLASLSDTRSLLCTGPHHPYHVPVCFNHLSLLRIIDALTVRFYEFPDEVVGLVWLRYLALTCDGKLPTSISKLSNLEVLIVRRYSYIVKLHKKGESSYMPTEIWDMKELQHLQVMGDDLIPEPHAGVVLPNLVTLMDANARSCTKGVLKGLPKLRKLGIRIELSTDDAEPQSISCHNNKLESLKCVVVNPAFGRSPLVSSLLFPTTLKKMSLNGLGCLWEDINEAVASLPKLKVLKLRCYAFRGAKWEIPEMGFQSLEFLLIEDTDLVRWTVGKGSFPWLRCLVLKECYKLQDIPLGFCKYLKRIEIVDCSPIYVACVKQMQAKRSTELEVFVDCSWDDDGKKLKA